MTRDEWRQQQIATYQTMCAVLREMLTSEDASIRNGAARRIKRFEAKIRALQGGTQRG